ncbi:hypothetical protein F0562_032141 [Nyssa sinensis]|uniref:RING-type E3 ubiquitin transferase n=1 Tax=Nyssa sinensis TaxID=561372 RepID=A0A5J5AWF7_9ASTE|nr:hypothetical protein F0562_032141 [Nyssa sinensis]
MNSTVDSSDASNNTGGQSIGGFGYGIGFSLGVLLLIIIITYASYLCTRSRIPARPNPSSHLDTTTTDDDDDSITVEQGLDEATLLSYPKLLYSQAKLHKGDSAASVCSICLADYKDSDMLRLLPDCGHLFHLNCVDPWLRLHPTCPICRNSPEPTPQATPVAEVSAAV